jgi:hypothetical protein
MPAIANMVKRIEIIKVDSKIESMKVIEMCLMEIPVIYQAIKPLISVIMNLIDTLTVFDKSSIKPIAKEGILASNIEYKFELLPPSITKRTNKSAKKIAIPPIRGVGLV